MKHPFNARNHFIVVHKLALIQLPKPFLHFSPEPLIVIKIGLHYFLHKLLGATPILRRNAFKLGFKFRTKSDFHMFIV
jgi:hypothetical protein